MKSKERIQLLSMVSISFVVVLCISLHPALANIYAYTASNGTVKLSNVPEDDHYTLLVAAPPDEHPVVESAPGPGTVPLNGVGKASYNTAVDEVARAYGLESALIHAVISVESRYRPKAISKKGAAGLMQLMPVITRQYGVADPLDPMQNLHGGAKYLRDLLKIYNNDVNLTLAAYNAGQGAVAKYGNRIPPYRETMNYVPKVLDFYRRYQAGARQANVPEGDQLKGLNTAVLRRCHSCRFNPLLVASDAQSAAR